MSTQKLSSLSIFMPAYNEEKNIQQVVKEALATAKNLAKDYEVIVVDDGSTDKTSLKVKQLQKRNPHLRLIKHPQNLGYGAAVKSGLKAAKMDWVFFTDSDGQFKFDELPKFVAAKDKADLIIGYRRKRMDPFHRVFVAQVLLKIWVYLLFGLKVKDVDCAYKLFPQKVVQAIELKTESAITVTEFLVKAKRQGFSFYQLPVTHYPRQHGTQTGGNLKVIYKAFKESLQLFFDLHR